MSDKSTASGATDTKDAKSNNPFDRSFMDAATDGLKTGVKVACFIAPPVLVYFGIRALTGNSTKS